MNLWVSWAFDWSGPDLADLNSVGLYVCSQLAGSGEAAQGWMVNGGSSAGSPGRAEDSLHMVCYHPTHWSGLARVAAAGSERVGMCEVLKSLGLKLPPATSATFYCPNQSWEWTKFKGKGKWTSPFWVPLGKDDLQSHITEGHAWKEEQRIVTTFPSTTGKHEIESSYEIVVVLFSSV